MGVLVFVAAISVLIACMFFFSPNWKYGIFIAFVDIAAIMISVIRKRRYYFLFDDNVRDWVRLDNPEKMTFGYCSRAWITTLLIFTALLYLLQFLLLLLAIFSLAKKFGRKPSEVIQLEVVQENAPVVVA